MFLRALRLRQLRSIRALDLAFADGEDGPARPWTYLLGENGSGKSTVLRAIALILAGSDAVFELIGEPDEWIRLGETEASIEVDFTTQENQHRSAQLRFERGMTVSKFVSQNRPTLRQLDAAISHSQRNYFVVGYGVHRRASVDRSRRSFPESYRSMRARAVGTLFSPDVSLVSIEQWAMDLDYRRGEQGIQAVKTALDQLLPDVTFSRIDREQRRLLFDTPDGVLPLSVLSDGYQAMAAWCGDLLWQITETFEDYTDPLRVRGLLLVDELDLHLHPVWQRRLVSFLKATLPNVQVVVTTHSPLTIHQADAGELFILRRSPEGAVQLNAFDGAPNRLMLHQLLESPLFGLDTLDSPQVEQARKELRRLQGIGQRRTPSASESARIRELKEQLSDVPDWRKCRRILKEQMLLLKGLRRSFRTRPTTPMP